MSKVIFSGREFSKTITGDRFSFFIFFICSLLVLFLSSLILVSWGKLPPELPLFYSRVWGQEMLASPLYLWILPAMTLAVTILNFSLSSFVASDSKFLARVLLIFALIVSLATTYTGAKIISLLI